MRKPISPSSRRWGSLTVLLLLLNDSNGFLQSPSLRTERSLDTLFLANPRKGAAAAGGKMKKKTGPTFGLKKKTGKADDKRKGGKAEDKNAKSGYAQQLSKAAQRSSAVLPSQKSKAPPWQVLSTKEAQVNVQTERKRRELAKQGIEMEVQEGEAPKALSKALLSDADRQLVGWKRFNPTTVPCGMTFVGAYLEKRLPPRLGVPEIAFLGRSNVGKSSLLNKLSASALGGDNDEARVGKTPGATASVNLYAMLGKPNKQKADPKPVLGLVDLPGFGYAKLSKEVQASVQLAAERYLGNREELALGILLVDARRVPSDDDRAVLAALYDLGLPIVVVATKIDKLAKNELEPAIDVICDRLGLPDGQPLCISSVTGEGTKDLWRIIMDACETKVDEINDKLQRTGGEEAEEVGTYQLDEYGDPILPDGDGDALSYEQGFDWIQDSTVMYEYGAKEFGGEEESDEGYDDIEDSNDSDQRNLVQDVKWSYKDLKKKAIDLEERGEV